MYFYIITALIVLILIAGWYMYTSDYCRRKRAQEEYNKSVGVYDEHARRAYELINNIHNPTPEDIYLRGRIVYNNIVRGNGVAPQLRNDYINNVYQEYQAVLANIAQQAPQDTHLFIVHDINEFLRDEILEWGGEIFGLTEQIQTNAITDRAASAQQDANDKLEAATIALERAQIYTNDSQNAHDTKVNADLRAIFARIKTNKINVPNCIAEVSEYIKKSDMSHKNKVAAAEVLEVVKKGHVIVTFDTREDVILACVWSRAEHPQNQELLNGIPRSTLIKDAVVRALADCKEDIIVCINGRCSRILAALCTTDFDRQNDVIMTFEAHKNQILQEVNKTINSCIQDPPFHLASAANAFNNGEDHENIDKFKEFLSTKIDSTIDAYGEQLNYTEIANIKKECRIYAGLDSH